MVTGSVKWWNEIKGFGFIIPDEGEECFVHYKDVKIDGRKNLEKGQRVEFDVEKRDKGPRAVNVRPLVPVPK